MLLQCDIDIIFWLFLVALLYCCPLLLAHSGHSREVSQHHIWATVKPPRSGHPRKRTPLSSGHNLKILAKPGFSLIKKNSEKRTPQEVDADTFLKVPNKEKPLKSGHILQKSALKKVNIQERNASRVK